MAARDPPKCKLLVVVVLSTVISQLIYSHVKPSISSRLQAASNQGAQVVGIQAGDAGSMHLEGGGWVGGDNLGDGSAGFGLLFAEAGKKKKKEKSEVVVISVNNPPQSKHGGGMYPIFIPSCGGGHGGYGRRKRSIPLAGGRLQRW